MIWNLWHRSVVPNSCGGRESINVALAPGATNGQAIPCVMLSPAIWVQCTLTNICKVHNSACMYSEPACKSPLEMGGCHRWHARLSYAWAESCHAPHVAQRTLHVRCKRNRASSHITTCHPRDVHFWRIFNNLWIGLEALNCLHMWNCYTPEPRTRKSPLQILLLP